MVTTSFIYVSGPGCSSVGYGATQELGPFIVDGHARELTFNPYSWNRGLFTTIVETNMRGFCVCAIDFFFVPMVDYHTSGLQYL